MNLEDEVLALINRIEYRQRQPETETEYTTGAAWDIYYELDNLMIAWISSKEWRVRFECKGGGTFATFESRDEAVQYLRQHVIKHETYCHANHFKAGHIAIGRPEERTYWGDLHQLTLWGE